jgi:hypothetical protein
LRKEGGGEEEESEGNYLNIGIFLNLEFPNWDILVTMK